MSIHQHKTEPHHLFLTNSITALTRSPFPIWFGPSHFKFITVVHRWFIFLLAFPVGIQPHPLSLQLPCHHHCHHHSAHHKGSIHFFELFFSLSSSLTFTTFCFNGTRCLWWHTTIWSWWCNTCLDIFSNLHFIEHLHLFSSFLFLTCFHLAHHTSSCGMSHCMSSSYPLLFIALLPSHTSLSSITLAHWWCLLHSVLLHLHPLPIWIILFHGITAFACSFTAIFTGITPLELQCPTSWIHIHTSDSHH